MKTCATVLSLAALSLSFLSMQVIADDKSADKKTNSEVTHHFRTSAIEGMAVRNHAGEDLGKVKDLVIELESGTIVYAALDFGGFIGIGDKLFAVPWDAFKLETNDKVEHLVLATTKEKLKSAPGFDKSHWPVAGDQAWSHVDKFYGPLKTAQQSTKPAALALVQHMPAEIPECLEKLKLSGKQSEQIKGIIANYGESMNMVSRQFGSRYMQTIELESQLLAAIEDNLTEPQREKVRSHRLKTAKYEKAVQATNTAPNQAKDQPVNALDEAHEGGGVTLTSEQEEAADNVEAKYRSQLRSMNRDIEGMHARMLSLSASKMVAIEKVLTKEQLSELRTHRKSAPEVKLVVDKN